MSQSKQKALRKAALIAGMAADTEPARVGRYFMEATRRAQATIVKRGLAVTMSPLIYGGIEGLAAATATAIVRDRKYPQEMAGPLSGYVAEALYGLVYALVSDFDPENYGAWVTASQSGETSHGAAHGSPGEGESRPGPEGGAEGAPHVG